VIVFLLTDLSLFLVLFLAGAAIAFWMGVSYYGFDIWAVAATVAIWGILALLVFWSADMADAYDDEQVAWTVPVV
jgi:hypothetical protein